MLAFLAMSHDVRVFSWCDDRIDYFEPHKTCLLVVGCICSLRICEPIWNLFSPSQTNIDLYQYYHDNKVRVSIIPLALFYSIIIVFILQLTDIIIIINYCTRSDWTWNSVFSYSSLCNSKPHLSQWQHLKHHRLPVSYTHLTLPTILRV